MKKVNQIPLRTFLTILFVGLVLVVDAQNVSNMLGDAQSSLQTQTNTLKTIFGYIFIAISGGAFIYAGYTAFFDQQQMRRAMIGLIVGMLFATIATTMNLIA